jgi:predicted permease
MTIRWFDDFVQDSRFALRTLRHSPGFALTAVVTLALGIGVNIGMFSLVNGLLLRPLYERPDEVVAVSWRSTTPSGEYRGFSYPSYLDLREGTADVFANLAAYSTVFAGLDVGEGPRRTLASAVTANYFQIFGKPLALGRPFTADEERLGADIRVAVISHQLWERGGADPGILGRSIRVNGEPFTVVGVAPKGFTGTSIPGPDVWVPLGAREAHELAVVGRLRAGAAIETAAPAVATVGRRLEQAFPAVNAGYTLEIATPSRLLFMPGPGSNAVTAGLALMLMVMPAIVLLVACLNLVDLQLARGQGRRQEMAIRSSLGGGRGRLTRQLVTEGLLIALAGGASGLLLSMWATKALIASVRPGRRGTPALRTCLGGQWPGDWPGRALDSPARNRWTVPDERALGGYGRSRVSPRRRLTRRSGSESGGVRRSARKAIPSRSGGSTANGPGCRGRNDRIEFSFHRIRRQSPRGSGWRRRCFAVG